MGFDHGRAKPTSYWVRLASERDGGAGIVVAVGWMFSKRRHLENFARIYGDAGYDSLVCHPDVLNLWFPSGAEALAVEILDELVKEVEGKPRPIVFASFSGGAKACLYKVFQILLGSEEAGSPYAGKYDSVTSCVRGQIHDSSPVDFVSSLGARFTTWSVSQALGRSVYGLPALTRAGARVLDALFSPEFEQQRADYWFALREFSKLGPVLILCSTTDHLAPFDVINKFAMMMRELGCRVDLVVWDDSDHVDHFRNFPKEYHDAVKTFLDQLLHPTQTDVWSRRILPKGSSETGSATQPSFSSCTSSSNTQAQFDLEYWNAGTELKHMVLKIIFICLENEYQKRWRIVKVSVFKADAVITFFKCGYYNSPRQWNCDTSIMQQLTHLGGLRKVQRKRLEQVYRELKRSTLQ